MNNGSNPSWEAHLAERAAAGDELSFEYLAHLYRPLLLSFATKLLRNQDDANDAVQETFLKAFRALRDFDTSRPVKPWLCRICANCCIDTIRGRNREGVELDQQDSIAHDARSVDDQATGNIRQHQLLEAISRLPDKYRLIIFMRHFRHMEVNEIAVELDKPEGTVKSWLYRARALLKKDLRPVFGA